MKKYYFSKFEDRIPYSPVKDNGTRSIIFQIAGASSMMFGFIYIIWRWTDSVNYDHPIYSFTLLVAESLSFVGVCLYVFDLWCTPKSEPAAPPHYLSDIEELNGRADRPISVDVFIASYNEEMELLRYTIVDAKRMVYPFSDVRINVYLLDDGRRDGRDPNKENVKEMCEQEGIFYLTRESNAGYKAGNLKNGLRHSNGDLFVILDADTRPFKNYLVNTLGYFRKHDVAWVQSNHWFYDTTGAIPLSEYLIKTFNIRSLPVKNFLRVFTRKVKTGEDIFGNDPRQFYEVIQRRRAYHNASFCCGACSIHRREAVMENALKQFSAETIKKTKTDKKQDHKKIVLDTDITPFMYHASEDLYTSMVMHSDRSKKWRSVMHPHVECKLLSPQDIGTYVKQRTRYAEGSIDIFLHDNPIFKRGLNWRQRVCYFHSVWCYFSCLWLACFLFAPVAYYLFDVLPVSCTSSEFFSYFLPFFICTRIADVCGSWGISQKRGKQYVTHQMYMEIMMAWLETYTPLPQLQLRRLFHILPCLRMTCQHPV
jgi:cellulose synthase (UDP-forming)